MTNEEKFVIEPLVAWFGRQKVKWEIVVRPANGTSETGWDLEVRRKNQDLLVEAKFMSRSSASAISGLISAPLLNRPQKSMANKYRSWCYKVCWAIGMNTNDKRNINQILLDIFDRSPEFWCHYQQDLNVKYIFLVKDGFVAKVPFKSLLNLASLYGKRQKLI